MSGYIILIMSKYYETLKEDDKNKLKDVIKNNKLIYTFILGIIIVWIIACILAHLKKSPYIVLTLYLIGVIGVLILLKVSDIVEQKNYKKNTSKYMNKLNVLRKILIEFGLFEGKKIERLIDECNKSIEYYKFSDRFYNSIKNIAKTTFIPIITFAVGIAINVSTLNLSDVIMFTIIALIIVSLGVFCIYELKIFLEVILDDRSSKIKNLKNLLIDINIKDFI